MSAQNLLRTFCLGALALLACPFALAQSPREIRSPQAIARPGNARVYPSPPSAKQAERLPPAPALIRIDATVVEANKKLGIDFEFTDGQVKSVKQSAGAITIISSKAKEAMIKKLVDSKAGQILSRPQIMTANKQEATVQVGRQVGVPTGTDKVFRNQHVGLTLKCRPTLKDQSLNMEINCEYNRLNDDGIIGKQVLETEIKIASGDTLVLSGVGDNGLIIFMTPDVVPPSFTKPIARPAPAYAQAVIPRSSVRIAQATKKPHPISATRSTSSKKIDSIDEAMRLLFPNERLQIIELPGSVVLQGSVNENEIEKMIQIAEQYFPTVINHLDVDRKPRAETLRSNAQNGLSVQINQVRNEVQALRGEVRKLTEMLKKNEVSSNSNRSQPTVTSAASYRDTSDQPLAKLMERWPLSLDEVVAISRTNHKDENDETFKSRETECKKVYGQLQSLHQQLMATKARTNPELQFEKVYSDLGAVGLTIATRRTQSEIRALTLRMMLAEQKLRESMGLPAKDGRLISPLNRNDDSPETSRP